MAPSECSHVVPFLMPLLDTSATTSSHMMKPLQKHPWSEPDFHRYVRSESNTSDEGVVADFPQSYSAGTQPSAPLSSDLTDCPPSRQNTTCASDDECDMRIGRNRLDSFARWPESCRHSPVEMAEAGFFYTGEDDIVQCAFCSDLLGNWDASDVPMEEHRRYYPRCPFVLSKSESLVAAESSGASNESSSSDDAEMAGEDICGWSFPSQTTEPLIVGSAPKYPDMLQYRTRFATFCDWPRTKTQRPQDLASAGLFYIGNGDGTTCFHCGGALHMWEREDDPWREHAKVYPTCEFLIASKGRAFIEWANGSRTAPSSGDEVMEEPEPYGLVRASLTNSSQASSTGFSATTQSSSGFDEETSSFPTSQDSDFSDRSMSDEDSEQEIIGQAIVRNLDLMDAIQQAVAESRQNLHFTRFHDEQHLVQAARAIRDREELQKKMTLEEAGCEAPPIEPSDIESLTKEYERLKKERVCKVCLVRDSQMIFHPCGHLVCCSQCSAEVQTCPVCRAVITQRSRVYIS